MTKSAKTSSFVFKLATKYTFYMMVLFLVIITGKLYFGESNSCVLSSGKIVDYDELNFSCWVYEEKKSRIDNYGSFVSSLIMQTYFFIIPLIIWYPVQRKMIPKSLKKLATSEINGEWINQRQQLINYIRTNLKKHHEFAISYLFCECLTLVFTIINMLLMHGLVNDFWNKYQSAATSFLFLDFPQFNRDTSSIFPKQATCSYFVFSTDFNDFRKNAVCKFPHNFLFDKIFAILYIWYIFILTWSVLHFIILIIEFRFKRIRLFQIRRMFERPATMCECNHISENGHLGLWFTLRIFRRNMQLAHYQDLCTGLLTEATCPPNA